MNTKQIIELTIYAMSVILPSTIAILTLVKKKYFNRGIQKIQDKINQNQQKTIQRFEQLTQAVNKHNIAVSKFLQNQNAAIRIRQITKHALQYCGNRQIAKVLQKFTQETISFIKSILEIGFQNTNKQQIIAKFTLSRENSLNFLKQSNLLTDQQYQKWVTYSTEISNVYINQICEIYQDVVNNKNSRFIIKTQDVLQHGVRQFILFVAQIDSTTRINIYGK